eukprot:9494252-Pyramimonas_sp.AAC.1
MVALLRGLGATLCAREIGRELRAASGAGFHPSIPTAVFFLSFSRAPLSWPTVGAGGGSPKGRPR